MAGDWIKIEHALPHKPEVMQIAELLALDEMAVVGHLVCFWSWVDQNLSPNCPHVRGTKRGLDRVAGKDGFMDALVTVGWVKLEGDLIRVENYDHHLSNSAKQRAENQRKKRRQRQSVPSPVPDVVTNLSPNDGDKRVTERVTREEKRREEKNNGGTPPNPPIGANGVNAVQGDPAEAVTWDPADVQIPEPLRDDPAFQAQWADWLFHLADKHRHPSRAQCKAQLAQLATLDPRRATQVLIEHLTAGWLSLDVTRQPSKRSNGSNGKPLPKVPIFRGARQEAASA